MQNTKPPLKEKFIQLSETLFRAPLTVKDPSAFWDTYLLLNVNTGYITRTIEEMSEEALLSIQGNLMQLFTTCVDLLQPTDILSDIIRQKHAMQLLACLFHSLFAKKRLSHVNIIHIVTRIDKADNVFGTLVQRLDWLMGQSKTRSWALVLVFVLISGNHHINQNNLNEYFMQNNLCTTLTQILADPESTVDQCQNALMVWGLLANYKKYEHRNDYLIRLHTCKDTAVLEAIQSTLLNVLRKVQSHYQQHTKDDTTLSQSVMSYFSRWLWSSASATASPNTIAPSSPVSPSSPSSHSMEVDMGDTTTIGPPPESALLLVLYELVYKNSQFMNMLIRTCTQTMKREPDSSSLIAVFVSYSSYLFQNNRCKNSSVYTRLVLFIYLRLVEEPAFLDCMAKKEALIDVQLCRQQLPPLPQVNGPRSFFGVLLDTMQLFMKHTTRKKMNISMFALVFAILHRLLFHLFKHRICLEYHWTTLWPTLASILHSIVTHLQELQNRPGFDTFLSLFLCVMNVCISHGEVFLSDTNSYDLLFYEIIRASTDITALNRVLANPSLDKIPETNTRTNAQVYSELNNIRLICNHFHPAIKEWQATHKVKYLSPEQVMTIMNQSYATLELGEISRLDVFVPLNEMPAEMGFFRQGLRTVVGDYMRATSLFLESI
ncbi:hypothetical protein BDF14DRAFT_1794638 [Spinellus fusiger]|nr:hypothetical protein BDF14DRAFT_1794638 [Spinellus fusiger]